MTSGVEREVKLAAWAGFELPDLSGVSDGVTVATLPDRQLGATYYDTPDLRLARWGVSVRFRSGDGEPGEGIWTVKLPDGDGGPALVRRELTFEGPQRVIPDGVSGLVRAYVRSAFLGPVAHLATRRRRVELRDAEGLRLSEIDDDEVSVLDGRRVAVRFREVEVEAADRAPAAFVDAVVERLRAAGAGEPDSTPKVVRALGPQAVEAPEVAPLPVDDDSTAADVVQGALATSLVRLLVHDPGVRLGDDPEDVHKARVAARRLRSDLRTFAPLLDADVVGRLRDELRWLGRELGAVRDADVLFERLRAQAAELPERDAKAVAGFLRRLADTREQARVTLLVALGTDRYTALLDALVDAARRPPCLPAADGRAGDVLPGLVRKPWKRLRKAVRKLDDDPPVTALHKVRIQAKRCRYAAEAAAPVTGKPAARLAKALARLQDVLGEVQDATVAEAWLREAGESGPAAQVLVAGELIAVQLHAVEEGRARWRPAWKKAKKRTAWLSG